MGCDLHLHGEIYISGQWHHYTSGHMPRQYWMFAKMAGVRNPSPGKPGCIEPLCDPRGLPADVSFVTRFEFGYDGAYGHSHSWLDQKEIAELFKWREEYAKAQGWETSGEDWDKVLGYLFSNGWAEFDKHRNNYPPQVNSVRWVFWFDN